MKKQTIKEFNKIYIAKYIEIIGKRQVAEDIHASQEKVEEVVKELKEKRIIQNLQGLIRI